MIEPLLQRLATEEGLGSQDIDRVFTALFDGELAEEQIVAFLTQMRNKPIKAEHLAGAAKALRARMTIVDYPGELLDPCGTGGDHQGTINISTGAAIVLAAAGVKVAKHGNKAVSSTSGSSDVLSLLGVQVNLDGEGVKRCLAETNLGFCFAPRFHPCLKRLAPIRKQLGFPTILNWLGPLANPAQVQLQVVGVGRRVHQNAVAEALLQLGVKRAAVVHGDPGLDEVSLEGTTDVFWVEGGKVKSLQWKPEDFGLPRMAVEELRCASANQSAERLRRIIDGRDDSGTPWILANVAAGLLVANRVKTLQEGVQKAQDVIRSGGAAATLEKLKTVSQSLGDAE